MRMNSERAELACVLVVLQACFSITAALVALPFAVVEPGFRVLALLTIGVGGAMLWLARQLRYQRRWTRRVLIALESISLLMSLLLMVLPIGAIRGPVPMLVNLLMPAWVVWLLWARRPPAARTR
jgi:hypothetical protein